MTKDAATVVAVLALALGWYGHRWLTAESDADVAKARAAAAVRALWRSRRVMVAVGLVVIAAVDMWFRGKGR
jgi:hypothetical protein